MVVTRSKLTGLALVVALIAAVCIWEALWGKVESGGLLDKLWEGIEPEACTQNGES